jgi:hypothetical protein
MFATRGDNCLRELSRLKRQKKKFEDWKKILRNRIKCRKIFKIQLDKY